MSVNDGKAKSPVKKRPRRRASVDGHRNILTVEGKEDGFEYRIVNDEGDRVAAFEDMGYEVVTHDVRIGESRVGRSRDPGSPAVVSVGGGKKAVLMRQLKENYEEDKALKAERIKRAEETMFKRDADYGDLKVEQRKAD